MVFGVVTSDGDLRPTFIFSRDITLNTEANIKCLEKVVLLWIEKVTSSGNWILHQYWQSENFCDHIIPNIWLSNSSDCNPFHYVWGAVVQETNKTPCNEKRWTEGKDKGRIYQFKQRDCRKGLQEIPQSFRDCGCSQWRFLWINIFMWFIYPIMSVLLWFLCYSDNNSYIYIYIYIYI